MKTNLPVLKIGIRPLITMLCAASAFLLIISPAAQAGYIVTLQQVGSDVVANGNGPIDLTGLIFKFSAPLSAAEMFPLGGLILMGPNTATTVDVYRGFTGPGKFGPGLRTFTSSGSGDAVGIVGPNLNLFVPLGYISGTPLTNSATYSGQTFGSLGVTPGTYVWRWGTGVNQNFTLQTAGVTVRDSGSTVCLLLLGLATLLGASRLRLA